MTADTDFLREMIGFSAQRLMELEIEGLTGAPHGTRVPDRLTHRNDYRERDWETRAGTVGRLLHQLPVRLERSQHSIAAGASEQDHAFGGAENTAFDGLPTSASRLL